MTGSAGEAAEGVVQPANAGASLGAQAAGYNQRFVYSVFTKDTSDEKGQATDTKVHVTL